MINGILLEKKGQFVKISEVSSKASQLVKICLSNL